jgi:cobalt-zinc-cadmium efflux system membrane fusion protein
MGQSVRMKFPPRAKIAIVAATTALILAAGCGRSDNAAAPPPADPGANASGPPTIQLSGDQLNTIKIGTVETHLFPVEKEAVGSIFFDEDPNTVQAESTLIGAAAAEEAATNVLTRARGLYDTNGVSKAELEQDTATEQTDRAALKAARDAVRALGETDDDIDQMIAASGFEAVQGVHTPPKWVQVNVAESDSPLIRVGQPVKVQVTAFPGRVFEGTVSKVYATVDSNTHRMAVRCEVDDPKDELRVGMLATAVIEVSKPIEATAIPPNGIVREGDSTMTAWVTTDRQHFTQRIIKTGMREDGEVQILDGLQRGELVVTDGAIFIDNMLQAPSDDD